MSFNLANQALAAAEAFSFDKICRIASSAEPCSCGAAGPVAAGRRVRSGRARLRDFRLDPFLFHPGPSLDYALWAAAFLICCVGTYAVAVLGREASGTTKRWPRLAWMIGAAIVCTCTMWVDAFLSVLAQPPQMEFGFRGLPMIGTFFVTFVVIVVAAQLTMSRAIRGSALIGGGLCGVAILASHGIGAHAMICTGTVHYNPWMLCVAGLLAIVFGMAAALTWLRNRSPVLSILLFATAIFTSHFAAGAATSFDQEPHDALPVGLVDTSQLALVLIAMTAVIIGCTLVARTVERKDRERRLAERKQLHELAEVAVEGLVIFEGDRVVWLNRSLEAMLGAPRSAFIGVSVGTLLSSPSLDVFPHDQEYGAHLKTRAKLAPFDIPIRVITRSLSLEGRPHVVAAIRDQRARLKVEEDMQRLAENDALTGLANRGRFNAALSQMFAMRSSIDVDGATAGGRFALLALDLDRFKPVNDTYGHAAGDAVLVEVARRLCGLVREGDLVSRVGGDEFAILASLGGGRDAIGALADRVIEAMSQPFVLESRVHQIGVSVGVAYAYRDGDDPEALTRSADLALYSAKQDGRGRHRLFEDGMRLRMQERNGLEQSLRRAIANEEFRLHFQPFVDARTGEVRGAEALIRWQHPDRGLVPPNEFIPLAEETGLIADIGEWVLRTACAEAVRWPDHFVVAVNVSPLQFLDASLAATIAATLRWSGLPGRCLEIEITENVLINDTLRVGAVLEELKGFGVQLALDDFGTGYSSLGHLHRFPFDKVKIDRSFVSGVPDDAGSVAIIRAVIALAAGLRMTTTAEGVETDAQRRFMTEASCDLIQGYFFGRPVAAVDLPAVFRRSVLVDDPDAALVAATD